MRILALEEMGTRILDPEAAVAASAARLARTAGKWRKCWGKWYEDKKIRMVFMATGHLLYFCNATA